MLGLRVVVALALVTASLWSDAVAKRAQPSPAPSVALTITVRPDRTTEVTYRLGRPTNALHFAEELGGYREQDWRLQGGDWRWTKEGTGQQVARADARTFRTFTFVVPIRYRHLPKSYAPFSPFSDGSALIYTGQFHVCLTAPCAGTTALPIEIVAVGQSIGVSGRRLRDRATVVSRDEGTNIFVGTLAPIASDSFVAIIDPGLPPSARDHLDVSLPRAMRDLASVYGPLSFRPELYVSIDARKRDDGHQSTQGGTLPGQIFMHFDGENARERSAEGTPFWLDWFFAHEAAHLFQQDKAGKLVGDDAIAWIHEGGADALAALVLAGRGAGERSYVASRVRDAGIACAKGLSEGPLDNATAAGNFDVHYQCGLLIWLAMDAQLRSEGHDGLNALNKRFFAAVRAGAAWDERTFLRAAQTSGVSATLLGRVRKLSHGGYTDAQAEVAALQQLIKPRVILAD